MKKERFNGEYNLLDYVISHKVLLFRYCKMGNINENTDLIFEGVFFIEVLTRIENIIIYEADEALTQEVINKINIEFYPEYDQKIFVIESEGRQNYIGCTRYFVQKNSLDYLQSSIR